jgi:hypothetical protein
VWRYAPSTTLGGTLKETMPAVDLYSVIVKLRDRLGKTYDFEDVLYSIVVFEGIWNLNGTRLTGFFSVNNDYTWRKSYYDIEIDAYAKGEFEDLVDALWKKQDIKALVPSFIAQIEQASRNVPAKPSVIYFSIGVPAYGDVSNLMAIHLPSRRTFISFLYSALSKSEDPWISSRVTPIRTAFFVNTIADEDVVQKRFERALEEVPLIEQKGGSVTYIAKDKDTFNKIFEKVTETIFKPALKGLPQAETLQVSIRKGLGIISLG